MLSRGGCKEALDALWGQLFSDRGRKIIPSSGDRWAGEAGDSLWIPDDDVVPPDKGYSNMNDNMLRLVVREVHDNIRHFGGVAILAIAAGI